MFAQLAGSIRSEIATGRLTRGEKLPAAKEVAGSLDVNLHTVLRAYQELRDEGLIDIRRGRGAVVTDAAVATTELHTEIQALVQRASALGISRATVAGLVRDVITEGEDIARRSNR